MSQEHLPLFEPGFPGYTSLDWDVHDRDVARKDKTWFLPEDPTSQSWIYTSQNGVGGYLPGRYLPLGGREFP